MLPLLKGGSTLNPGVDVAIVQLLVEDQEELIFLNEWSDLFGFRPWRILEVLLRQLREGRLVEVGDLEAVAFVDHVTEVGQELPDRIRDVALAAAVLTLELAVQSRVAGGSVVVVIIVLWNKWTMLRIKSE